MKGRSVSSSEFRSWSTEQVGLLDPYWTAIDQVTIVGTPMGTKGTSMQPSIFTKIREARAAIAKHAPRVEIQLDGGIRRNTVPQIHEAGADWIVPGSLMFGEDPALTCASGWPACKRFQPRIARITRIREIPNKS